MARKAKKFADVENACVAVLNAISATIVGTKRATAYASLAGGIFTTLGAHETEKRRRTR